MCQMLVGSVQDMIVVLPQIPGKVEKLEKKLGKPAAAGFLESELLVMSLLCELPANCKATLKDGLPAEFGLQIGKFRINR